jgi:hypothetical protein
MLDPQQDRRQLFGALRPPNGYRLDRAIGTTYSLDLLALLTIPLAYTFWGGEDEEGNLAQDPLALLYGVRQVMDRLTIFCQAGQIGVPHSHQRLFTYLEDSIFQVTAPHREGVFHPKIWLLRYVAQTDGEAPAGKAICYRLLCLSRNLTFDRSWDTMLVLDGRYQAERKVAYGRNHPLGDFVAALPTLATRQLTPAAQEAVALLSAEVRKVQFELPWQRGEVAFLPLGLTGRRSWPFPRRSRRQLIVSPFITPGFLKQMGAQADQNILISRLESVAAIKPDALAAFNPIYILDPATDSEAANEEEAETTLAPLAPSSGLHAKLFLCEYGHSKVEMFTGSANATEAAFSRNVEFLVKIKGWGAELGIDKLLIPDKQGDKEIRLLDLLQEYTPGGLSGEPDGVQERLEQLATQWQRYLARLPLQALVSVREPTTNPHQSTFDITLSVAEDDPDRSPLLALPDNVQIVCWPITRRQEEALAVDFFEDSLAIIGGVSYPALTSFIAFAVTAEQDDERYTRRFVLNLPLLNAPEDRREQTLRALLDSQQKVLSYLLFLVAETDVGLAEIGQLTLGQERLGGTRPILNMPADLFESLVRALYKDPARLDQVSNLITDLQKSGHIDLLPDGFNEIWPPIWEARQLLRRQVRAL